MTSPLPINDIHDEKKAAETALSPHSLPITVIVATRNEEANIRKCVLSLSPALRIIIADSSSTDNTPVVGQTLGAEVINFSYAGGYPKKRQWVLDHLDISTPWVMLVDADEQITPELWQEIHDALASTDSTAYLICKEFHFLGKRFRFGGFSHSAIALFRRGSARFEQLAGNLPNEQDMEVHERLIVDGKIGRLRNKICHNDYKGLHAYIDRHNKYSTWEAGIRAFYLKTGSWGDNSIETSLRGDVQSFRRAVKSVLMRFPGESWLWFIYHYFVRGGIFEGRRGFIAASIRKSYIEQVHAKIYELALQDAVRVPIAEQPDSNGATHNRVLDQN